MSLESTTTHGGPGGPGGAAGSNGGGASAPGAATDIALSSPDLMVSPPASAPVSQLATAPPSTAGTELTLSIGLSPEPSLIGTTTAASAITAAAGPALEEPRALVTYRDDFRLWPHVEAQLVPRLPLRNLTWRSMRGTRTIPQLDVHLKPFDPATLPKSAMFASLTPALHLYFVNCDDIETYRQIIRPSIQSWVAHFTGANAKRAADQDWCIVYIMTAAPGSENAPGGGASTSSTAGTAASSMSKFASQTSKLLGVKTTVLDKIKADFGSAAPGLMSPMAGTGVSGSSTSGSSSGIGGSSSASGPAKRLERVISLRLMGGDMSRTHDGWADFFARVKDGVLASFAAQVAHYDDDIARIDAQRLVPGWNYTSFFLLKEGLAQCFAAVALADDAALQYDELDAAFEQTVHLQVASFSTFGATDPGDDDVGPVLLNSRTPTKDYRALMLANNISVFDFRVYLAARQLALAVRAHRPLEVARRATKWVHLISPLVATEIMSHRLSASRSDEPSAVANPENTIPAHFTDSLTLAVAEAALAAIDSMLTTMRPGDMDMIERVHAARLELALLGKSALDRIGAARFGMRPTLWPATPTFGGADPSSSSSPESDQLDARITNPTARAALTSADQFASVYAWFLDTAAHAARRAEKPRVAAMLATDRANLDYALGRWADAGDGYARVVAMYAAQGWLAVDRCVLQRQAQCYRRVGARNEYLLTGLRLVASDIVHHATGSGVASAGTSAGAGGDATATAAEGDVDWAQLAQVARELEEPVVVEFAPLFDCELPPYLFASAVPGETGSCGTVELGVVSVTGPSLDDMFDGVAIVSHLGIPLTVDRIALTLVGGETNDLVFLSASNSGVTLVPRSGPRPGVTRIPMVWEKPSTAGEYVAEKVRIEIGKLVFVTNLLKENRKHTLRIHEPPAPVALRLSLPPVLLPENDQVLLSIESTAATATGDHHHPGGTLSLWSLHPQPAVLRPAALAMVDAHGRVVAPLEEIPPLSDDDGPTGQYVVPAGASAIVLSVPAAALSAAAAASSPTSSPTFLSSGNVASDPMYTKLPWRKLTLKAVFESASTLDESLLSSDDGFTVSLVDTVRNAVAPAIEADVQVIGGMDQFIMATVTNDDPSGVLCVEGTHVELEGDGAAVLLSDSYSPA
ncbi:hypothetical protein BC828DRAFT_46612 [Blastocladiella britannica]|nr:hypothetical protein BC828DRAFT_46612 [Blastocladiella britannica]